MCFKENLLRVQFIVLQGQELQASTQDKIGNVGGKKHLDDRRHFSQNMMYHAK